MSEYQYYEWQAIDRALTEEEVGQVGELSSHMDVVTATQAIVTYQWGDFKHDPAQVLLRYFDAMLYWANWGSLVIVDEAARRGRPVLARAWLHVV